MEKETVAGCLIGVVVSFSIVFYMNKNKFIEHDPDCNGIYQVNGYMPCESPWSKSTGSTKYFYIREPYNGYLICALWTGSDMAFDNYESSRAWGTQKEAEEALGKKFLSSGTFMKEIH